MEPVDFNKAPEGATHYLRYDSGYVVWICVVEDGPNGLPIVKEWDIFNQYWVPAWYRDVDGKLFVWRDGSWQAGAFKSIPELASSCMLGKLIPLVEGKVELETVADWAFRMGMKPGVNPVNVMARAIYEVERKSGPVDLFAVCHRLRNACRVMRDQPGDCNTEGVDAVYKVSRELLIQRDALPGDLSSKALVAAAAVQLLRNEPHMFSANELADLHQLCDAELTKRDAAVCGSDKYLDAHWFERGELPPVGTKCEFTRSWFKEWKWCEILFMGKFSLVMNTDKVKEQRFALHDIKFRPISTERDELIEVIKTTYAAGLTNLDMLASAILAAGFKRGGAA